jgi:ribosomal protein S18 acetylase RimI-like enzyme
MNFEIKEINISDSHLLQEFISNNTSNFFRYFYNRPISVIENHLFTILYIINNKPIGYAHIDNDNGIYWFGICILTSYHNMGIGKKIMTYIFEKDEIKNKDIFLTVDKNNEYAILLYKKFGFEIIETKNFFLKMKRNKLNL